MTTMDSKPVITPNQQSIADMKRELEVLAEKEKNPKLVESFNNFLAKKSAQVF